MIKHLYIKNFVLIDELDLDLTSGFSALRVKPVLVSLSSSMLSLCFVQSAVMHLLS